MFLVKRFSLRTLCLARTHGSIEPYYVYMRHSSLFLSFIPISTDFSTVFHILTILSRLCTCNPEVAETTFCGAEERVAQAQKSLVLQHKIALDAYPFSVLRLPGMKHKGVSTYQSLLSACAGLALFAFFLIPSSASALEVQSKTAQLLPPNGSNCAPVQVANFTPYVYSEGMDSFEFTVADPSYVAVSASVGNDSIPFHYITRWPDASGGVRIHVDTYSTPLDGSVPVIVTLMSARTGSPVCALVVAVNLGANTPTITTTASTTSTPTASAPTSRVAPTTHATVPTVTRTTSHTSPSSAAPANTSSSNTASATTASAVQNPIAGLCAAAASAYRLWLILLIAYALLVGGLLWLEFPLSWTWAKTPERVAMVILGALVLLLAFWYLSASCRAALWMPLLAFLIAVLGLLAAFWNHPKVSELLLLEQKTTIVTPPPTKK